MWRFKHFGHKEPSGLEGRTIDVGNLKIHVRNAIAEGGFSCVYLARDAFHMSKQYALKHMICNDEESLELVNREISVMKSLQGHPNVVTLHAHSILDMGRVKEALLVMEFCEKSLVNVLESRGVGYFDEKQILSIFRDVCNAVFAMHCQSPPISHRDLKAENLLLGPDGSWKLCDFGSTSTNHKRFEKPEEMGIEEDNIRKQTTPAYRAPEMWDLFRREFIGEKVDIWALGCLLFRICYFKNAFDGESKLQILNGNYRIPDLPKYSSSITDLIRDMLQDSPHDRPDITQVWFRVNEQLPVGLQKSLPDRPPGIQSTDTNDGISKSADKSPPMPRRSPPPVPSSSESMRNSSQAAHSSSTGLGGGGQLGAFWSSQHAKNSLFEEEKSRPKFDEEVTLHSKSEPNRIHSDNHLLPKNPSSVRDESTHSRNTQIKTQKDLELTFPQKSPNDSSDRSKPGNMAFQDNTFNSFVAEFDTEKFISGVGDSKARNEAALEAEIEKLKDQLKQSNSEKTEITSKFEKLSAICRSQRHEIQELKQALASSTQNKEAVKNETPPMSQSSSTSLKEKEEGQGRFLDQRQQEEKPDWSASSKEQKQWLAFAEEPKSQLPSFADKSVKSVKSVRTRNSQQKKDQVNSGFDSWGFGSDSFTAVPASNFHVSKPMNEGNSSQRFGEAKIGENKPACQPAGWAGF